VNGAMNLWIPWNFGKFLSSCATGVQSRRAQLHVVSHSRVSYQDEVATVSLGRELSVPS
jgi:hypothetical protein